MNIGSVTDALVMPIFSESKLLPSSGQCLSSPTRFKSTEMESGRKSRLTPWFQEIWLASVRVHEIVNYTQVACILISAFIARTKPDSGIPCDLLLLRGTCIVNEAMLSGESTPLLKESIELRDGSDRLDMNGSDRNNVMFSGTKALQVTQGEGGDIRSK